MVLFSDSLRFPVRPMVGVIGVTPAGQDVLTGLPGPHGGNLDLNEVAVGATVYLPIQVEGGLLGLGDVHASMGDGELTSGGIDIGAQVTVRVDLLSGRIWPRPWIETRSKWITCATHPDLTQAIRLATSDMLTLLQEKLGVDAEDALMLVGARGDAKLGQAADLGTDVTACVCFPKLTPSG